MALKCLAELMYGSETWALSKAELNSLDRRDENVKMDDGIKRIETIRTE